MWTTSITPLASISTNIHLYYAILALIVSYSDPDGQT